MTSNQVLFWTSLCVFLFVLLPTLGLVLVYRTMNGPNPLSSYGVPMGLLLVLLGATAFVPGLLIAKDYPGDHVVSRLFFSTEENARTRGAAAIDRELKSMEVRVMAICPHSVYWAHTGPQLREEWDRKYAILDPAPQFGEHCYVRYDRLPGPYKPPVAPAKAGFFAPWL